MTEHTAGYAVFLFDQAAEALGEAIKPYLRDGPAGPHIPCEAVDTGGALVEMTLRALTAEGDEAEIELMIPLQMVRMVVSMRSDGVFGFSMRGEALQEPALPVVGPHAPAPRTPSSAVPSTAAARGGPDVADDRRRPPEG